MQTRGVSSFRVMRWFHVGSLRLRILIHACSVVHLIWAWPAVAAEETGSPTSGSALSLGSNQFRFRWWKTDQGLPQSWVECITQTPDGYLWLGTRGGLVRFDGFKFTLCNDVFPSQIGPVFAKAFTLDSEGALWIATKRGLLRRDQNGFTALTAADGLCHNEVSSLCASRSGGMWIGTAAGVSRFVNGHFQSYSTASWVRPFIYSVCEDARGGVWVGTFDGLMSLDPASGAWKLIEQKQPAPQKEDERIVRFIIRDRSDKIWFGTDHSLFCKSGEEIIRVPGGEAPLGDRVRSVYQDRQGELWLVKANALSRLVDGHTVAFDEAAPAADAELTSLFQDREGNYWIGTAYGGLCRMQSRVLLTYTTRDGLSHNDVWSVSPARDGGVWIATSGGISHFKDGRFQTLPKDPEIPDPSSRSVIEDSAGDLWIGTAFVNFFYLHKSATSYVNLLSGGVHPQVRVVYEDRNGEFWIGAREGLTHCVLSAKAGQPRDPATMVPELWLLTSGKLSRYDNEAWWIRQSNQWKHTLNTGGTNILSWEELSSHDTNGWTRRVPEGELSDYDVRAILQDRSDTHWFGTANGLNRLANHKFTAMTVADGLVSNSIRALYEDEDGALWIGTREGLTRMKAGRCFPLTVRHGLFDNCINAIVQDDLENFWLSCPRGIFRVSRDELDHVAEGRRASVRSIVFDEGEGMLSAETNGGCQPAGCKAHDGKIWFPTVHGVVVIDPMRVKRNDVPPPVLVESVHAAREELLWSNEHGPETLESAGSSSPARERAPSARAAFSRQAPGSGVAFRPGSGRFLEFNYTAASFSAPEHVRFKYQLQGWDNDWIDAGSRRTAYYTNLRPGAYRFRVIACNNHNVWNETGAMLAFVVKPYAYQTWWFRTAAVVVVLFVGLVLVLFRLHEMERVHRLEKQAALAQERRRIARDLHDQIGSQLTRLVLTSTASTRPAPSGENSSQPAQSLADEALRGLEQVIWLTDPAKDTLAHTLEYLCRYSREFLAGTPIQLTLDIPIQLPDVRLSAAARHAIIRTSQEALANVLKHSHASEVRLRFRALEKNLELAIEDNGQGFDPANVQDRGNGLGNMRERVTEIGGAIQLESQVGAGTRLRIQLPMT